MFKLIQQLGGVMKKLLFILLLGLGFSQTELTTRVYNTGALSSLQEIDIDSNFPNL